MNKPCPHCKTTIKHGTRYGCCSGCRRVFVGQAAFNRHQTIDGTGVTCHHPATLTVRKGKRAGEAVYRSEMRQGWEVWALNSGPSPWAAKP